MDLGCAAFERRENSSDFLVVQGEGYVAGFWRGNHEVGHDLAVEIGAQADRNKFVADDKCGLGLETKRFWREGSVQLLFDVRGDVGNLEIAAAPAALANHSLARSHKANACNAT